MGLQSVSCGRTGDLSGGLGQATLPSSHPRFQDSLAPIPPPSPLPALPGWVLAEAEVPHIWVEVKGGCPLLLAHPNSQLHSCRHDCRRHLDPGPLVSWGQMATHLHAHKYTPQTNTRTQVHAETQCIPTHRHSGPSPRRWWAAALGVTTSSLQPSCHHCPQLLGREC